MPLRESVWIVEEFGTVHHDMEVRFPYKRIRGVFRDDARALQRRKDVEAEPKSSTNGDPRDEALLYVREGVTLESHYLE